MSAVSPPRRVRRSGDRFIPVRDRDSTLGLDSTQLRFNLQDATEYASETTPLRLRGDTLHAVDSGGEERFNTDGGANVAPSSASPLRQRVLLMAARMRYGESGEALGDSLNASLTGPEANVARAMEQVVENARLDWTDVFGPGSGDAPLYAPVATGSAVRATLVTAPLAQSRIVTGPNGSSPELNPQRPETRRVSGAETNSSAAVEDATHVQNDLEALLMTFSHERRTDLTASPSDTGTDQHAAARLRQRRLDARRQQALIRLMERMNHEQQSERSRSSPALQSVTRQARALLQAAVQLGDGADDESVVELAMELFANPQGVASTLPYASDMPRMVRAVVTSPPRPGGGSRVAAHNMGMTHSSLALDGGPNPGIQGVVTAPEMRSGIRSTTANTNAVLALSAHLPPHAQHATIESTARAASEATYLAQVGGLGTGTPTSSGMAAGGTRVAASGPTVPSTYAIILENELLHEVNTTRTDLAPDLEESRAESSNPASNDHGSTHRWQTTDIGQATPPRQASGQATGNSPGMSSASRVRDSSVSLTTPSTARRSLLEFSRSDLNGNELNLSPGRRGPAGSAGRRGGSPVHQDALRTSPVLASDPTVARELGLGMRRTQRKISSVPYKVLDAPNLADDFYLNLIDWSTRNILAVGLGNSVYLWNAYNSKVIKLCDMENLSQGICSVSWSQRGDLLAVGIASGQVHLYDPAREAPVRILTGHTARVGCLAWNGSLLASGSRDRTIMQYDIRVPTEPVRVLEAHRQEVCGLRWSFDQTQLASGGNDNKLFIWTPHARRPLFRFAEHEAAVKAIAWSPHQHSLLASGGGTADRCIRFWNTTTGAALQCIDTGSQVCNLLWSRTMNELVSTHGYSQNQIVLWRYPSMQKVATLTGHLLRVLYLAASPDGSVIVTGAGDETLRFWSVFPPPRCSSRVSYPRNASSSSPSRSGGTRSLFAAALADMTALPSAYAPPASNGTLLDDPWNTSSVIPSSFIR